MKTKTAREVLFSDKQLAGMRFTKREAEEICRQIMARATKRPDVSVSRAGNGDVEIESNNQRLRLSANDWEEFRYLIRKGDDL